MSSRSKFILSASILFTTFSILAVYKMKSDALEVRRSGVVRDDLKRAQRNANMMELEAQINKRKELELEQKVSSL